MHSLTTIGKTEKNKLYSDGTWLLLLEIHTEPTHGYICCRNTEDFNWGGHLWTALPIELGAVNESVDGADPAVDLTVDNLAETLTEFVESTGGGVNTPITLRVVNSKSPDSEPEIEEQFMVQSAKLTLRNVVFRLGTEYSARTLRPLRRYIKNNCPYKYKGVECGYNGNLPTCKKTLTECRAHNNSQRYGGYPAIDQQGVYTDV